MRWHVLRDPNLRVLLAGQTLNMFGNSAMYIVLAIWVKDLTGSTSQAGLTFLLIAISTLLAPAAGMVADRFPRRWVLFVDDILTGLLVASLLTVHDRGDVWLIYAVTFGYGCSGQVYRAARGGLLHSMVPGELLGDANGLFSSLSQGVRIIGPIVGAAIYTSAGGGAVALVNVATFFLSAGSYLLLRRLPDLARPSTQDGTREPFFQEVIAGLKHVARHAVIRRLVLASAVAFTGAGMINVAIFALVDEGLHRPAAIIGVLGGVQGVGSVIAGLSVGPTMRRIGEYATASIGFLLNGVGLAAAATATLPGVVAGAILVGLGLPMVLVAEITLVQRRTPAEMQGRAISASDAFIDVPFAIAIGVGAAVISVVGFRPIYLSVAASFTLVGLALLRYTSVTRPSAESTVDETADESAVERIDDRTPDRAPDPA